MKKQTRRDFLACSGLGTLGMMTGGTSFAGGTVFSGTGQAVSEENEDNGVYQYTRKIPVGDTYDLVVAGGGPAGCGAAISAARLGARVLLVEATGCLGGMGTSGLVTAFDPMANGKEMLVGGLMREIVETLYKRNFLTPGVNPDRWRKYMNNWTPFQVEGYKLILDELVVDAGVHVMFFTKAIDVDADSKQGKVNGVIINNIEGQRYIKAKTFVDCTGDGYLAKLCGVVCRDAGTDTPNIMPSTLTSLFAGIKWNEFKGNQYQALNKALEAGHFTQYDRHLPGMSQVNHTVGYLNGGHVFNLNALRCKDLTDGMILGRKIAQEYLDFYRKYLPGCENIELVVTADLMGVRESRRILGEYELNYDDYMARRKFPDQIGLFCKFIDIHPYNTSKEEWDRHSSESGYANAQGDEVSSQYKTGEYFGMPYGIIVPKGWKNFWVAGRCASSDVRAQGSIRVQPACSMMGQAAGTAAVQSIKTGQPANDLDTEMLVKTLREAGANLPQETLSKKMTRA